MMFQKAILFEDMLSAGKILATGDSVLAECAVNDCIWGIGLGMRDERRLDINCWRGQNLLGYALMEVRDYLKSFSFLDRSVLKKAEKQHRALEERAKGFDGKLGSYEEFDWDGLVREEV